MNTVILWSCLSFGKMTHEGEVLPGDMIVNKIATGILHEISLLSNLDIRNLEEENGRD